MNLMLVVNWYPPDRRVPARRWGNIVAEFQKQGINTTVVSAGNGNESETIGSHGEQIIRLPISNQNTAGATGSTSFEKSRVRKSLGKIFSFCCPPILRDFSSIKWFFQYFYEPRLIATASQADVIISSYGPLGPLMLGSILACKAQKTFIIDIRDSFEARDGISCKLGQAISRRIERHLLALARMRITVGDTLAGHLESVYHLKFMSLYNGWTDDDLVYRSPNPDHSLFYAGTIYQHQLDALAIVLQGLIRSQGLRLRIRLLNDNTNGDLLRLIQTLKAEHLVDILPPADNSVIKEEMSSAAAVLVLEDLYAASPWATGTITGKFFGLLASGVPGIVVANPRGELWKLASNSDTLRCAHTLLEFQQALEKITELSPRKMNQTWLSSYSVHTQTKKFIQRLTHAQTSIY